MIIINNYNSYFYFSKCNYEYVYKFKFAYQHELKVNYKYSWVQVVIHNNNNSGIGWSNFFQYNYIYYFFSWFKFILLSTFNLNSCSQSVYKRTTSTHNFKFMCSYMSLSVLHLTSSVNSSSGWTMPRFHSYFDSSPRLAIVLIVDNNTCTNSNCIA